MAINGKFNEGLTNPFFGSIMGVGRIESEIVHLYIYPAPKKFLILGLRVNID